MVQAGAYTAAHGCQTCENEFIKDQETELSAAGSLLNNAERIFSWASVFNSLFFSQKRRTREAAWGLVIARSDSM